jgi:hypothetical protein
MATTAIALLALPLPLVPVYSASITAKCECLYKELCGSSILFIMVVL